MLALKDGADKKKVMTRLTESDIEVLRFGSYEPTLNDIFVAKAGDN